MDHDGCFAMKLNGIFERGVHSGDCVRGGTSVARLSCFQDLRFATTFAALRYPEQVIRQYLTQEWNVARADCLIDFLVQRNQFFLDGVLRAQCVNGNAGWRALTQHESECDGEGYS